MPAISSARPWLPPSKTPVAYVALVFVHSQMPLSSTLAGCCITFCCIPYLSCPLVLLYSHPCSLSKCCRHLMHRCLHLPIATCLPELVVALLLVVPLPQQRWQLGSGAAAVAAAAAAAARQQHNGSATATAQRRQRNSGRATVAAAAGQQRGGSSCSSAAAAWGAAWWQHGGGSTAVLAAWWQWPAWPWQKRGISGGSSAAGSAAPAWR
jgi:hypothetical protein